MSDLFDMLSTNISEIYLGDYVTGHGLIFRHAVFIIVITFLCITFSLSKVFYCVTPWNTILSFLKIKMYFINKQVSWSGYNHKNNWHSVKSDETSLEH